MKLKIAIDIVTYHIADADGGIFNSRNTAGDVMKTVYDYDGLRIDICRGWGYFEVFGLSEREFEVLEAYYHIIR